MQDRLPKPEWLKVRLSGSKKYEEVRAMLSGLGLRTVCTGARCPNSFDCWGRGACTFMIMGGTCTRACRFCAVDHERAGDALETDEPDRLAAGVKRLGLDYAVITSVDRDDLDDGGAGHYAACIRVLKRNMPGIRVEALIPDFAGRLDRLGQVVAAGPDVIAHNLETVERLTPPVRDRRAGYRQSLGVLGYVKMVAPWLVTKSSLLLGLGETDDEVKETIVDLREAGVDVLTLGQYLRPGPGQASVERYVSPAQFDALADFARSLGFGGVAAGPFVRSSYRAAEHFDHVTARRRAEHGRPVSL